MPIGSKDQIPSSAAGGSSVVGVRSTHLDALLVLDLRTWQTGAELTLVSSEDADCLGALI